MKKIEDLKIRIFGDGADIEKMKKLYDQGIAVGFTTNPWFISLAGVTDYEKFAKEAISAMPDASLIFEVISDDFDSMEREARKITTWGENVFAKIPVTNTKGEYSTPLIKKLSSEGLKLCITVLYTTEQIKRVADAIAPGAQNIVAIFAGRIGATGVDPVPIIKEAVKLFKSEESSKVEVMWAATREIYNIFEAEECGCDSITAAYDILEKLDSVGVDLEEASLQVIKMFYDSAQKSGFVI